MENIVSYMKNINVAGFVEEAHSIYLREMAKNGKLKWDIANVLIKPKLRLDSCLCGIFSSNGIGTITAVKEQNANTFSVQETIKTQKGARTIAVNKTTGDLYLPTADFGQKPEPTKENPKPRPGIIPNSFVVLVINSSIK